MHAVVRSYSGAGVQELFDLIEESREEVEALIRGVEGFVSYSIIRQGDSAATVTVCADKAGTDQSIQIAHDWIRANAPDLGVAAPSITEGRVAMHWA
jgi:hypothetical protein